eukprot:07488.XXX_450500_450685_1 [CDS] Oithona nana genome sequencing.
MTSRSSCPNTKLFRLVQHGKFWRQDISTIEFFQCQDLHRIRTNDFLSRIQKPSLIQKWFLV